jgi:invasion protein IalB
MNNGSFYLGSFVSSFVGSFVSSFVGSFVSSFVGSFLSGFLLLVALLIPALSLAEDRVADSFGDWTKICSPDGDVELCWISQVVDRNESGQRMFRTVIRYLPESEDPLMFLTAPLGIFLPRGITLELSEDTLMTSIVQRCDTSGCLAVSAVEPAFVAEMKAGREAKLVFGASAEQNVAVPFSLIGFTDAINSIVPGATSAVETADKPAP